MKFAIVEDGGKQYKAVVGETIEVDHFSADVGDELDLEHVLLVADNGDTAVGAPYVDGAVVKATVISQVKAPKVIVFKYKPRNRYRVKQGHRQKYTRIRIDAIETA